MKSLWQHIMVVCDGQFRSPEEIDDFLLKDPRVRSFRVELLDDPYARIVVVGKKAYESVGVLVSLDHQGGRIALRYNRAKKFSYYGTHSGNLSFVEEVRYGCHITVAGEPGKYPVGIFHHRVGGAWWGRGKDVVVPEEYRYYY